MSSFTIELACPSCRNRIERVNQTWICRAEGLRFDIVDGIPDFIIPSQREEIEKFLSFYSHIRAKEGWGYSSLSSYTELPYRDLSKRFGRVWHLRRASFEALIADLEASFPSTTLRILDVGAGNCWLSHRLANRGHDVTALDLNLDPEDGLGVGQRMLEQKLSAFHLVRAHFDHLPFPSSAFDVIVFNASLHYSNHTIATLRNAMKSLRRSGVLYIVDSPIYRDERSGLRMVVDRVCEYKRKYGIDLPKRFQGSFLTIAQMEELASTCSIEHIKPRYGLRWILRRNLVSFVLGREAAVFKILKVRQRNEIEQSSSINKVKKST